MDNYDGNTLSFDSSPQPESSGVEKSIETSIPSTSQEIQRSSQLFPEINPAGTEVDGEKLIAQIKSILLKHVHLTEVQADALSLWLIAGYCFDSFNIFPYVGITSPQKRCGKSTLLFVLKGLANRAISTSNITPAALYQLIEENRPTLLIDEADTFIHKKSELVGIINSGHSKVNAYIIRGGAFGSKVNTYSTWCPKAIAAIGELPNTVRDRSISINMRRRKPDEIIENLPVTFIDDCEIIRSQCARWALDNQEIISSADILVPHINNDRASDNWRPLIAIGSLISNEWQGFAIKAMESLSDVSEDEDVGRLLLIDIQSVFNELSVDRISSEQLVNSLNLMEDRPWADFKGGKQLSKKQLAELLKPYGIRPASVRFKKDKDPIRGYKRVQFDDAFARYI